MNASITAPFDRAVPQPPAQNLPWLSATRLSRIAGLCALGFLVFGLGDPTGNTLHANPSAQHVLDWAANNERLIYLGGFLAALSSTALGVAVLLVLTLTGRRGALPRLVCIGVAVAMATGWTKYGIVYAMAELAHRGGADAGVQALFTLGGAMDFADGIAWALAIGGLSFIVLHTRLLPPTLGWFGLLLAAVLVVSPPVMIAGAGFINPVNFGLGLLWSLTLGVVLTLKPVRTIASATAGTQAIAYSAD